MKQKRTTRPGLAELRAQVEAEVEARGRVEAALRQFEKALETTQLGVTISDVSGKILYSNPADARMHGYGVEDLVGQDVGIFSTPEERHPLTVEELRRISSWRRESVNVRRDGTRFPVQLMSDVVVGPDGDPVGVVTTCEDITERKRAERALQRAYDELDQRVQERTAELSEANVRLREEIAERQRMEEERVKLEAQLRQALKMEALGRLTGGIAHDFNNLLTVMLANADLIADALPTTADDLTEELDILRGAGQKARDLVKKLLSFSRQQDLNLRAVNVTQLVAGLQAVLRRLIPEDIELRIDTGEVTERVLADPGAVEQVLINLATNARDAMPSGGRLSIALSSASIDGDYVAAHPGARVGRYVRIEVADTGLGMDARTREHIFEPFFTTKPLGVGTGLGMAMIYGLVEQHGGFIEVESEPGEGARFALYFPLARAAAPAGPYFEEGRPEMPRGTETILLVEDDSRIRKTGGRILERAGYHVLVAADGEEALRVLGDDPDRVALVISDVVMPNMTGYELRAALRERGIEVPFLYTTGHASPRRSSRPRELDAPALPKPWTMQELTVAVRQAIDGPENDA